MDCNPGTVNVYASMNLQLTKDLEITVADLLCIPEQCIILKHVIMQYQIGASDCGQFAIASACAICNGENPAEILDQGYMRKHLLMAFNIAILTLFPSKQLRRHQPISGMEKSFESIVSAESHMMVKRWSSVPPVRNGSTVPACDYQTQMYQNYFAAI